jgi:hypothetical protein
MAAARLVEPEASSVEKKLVSLAQGQVVNEGPQVHPLHAPPVLGLDPLGPGLGHHPLPAIPGDVGVDPVDQGLQKGGLAVEPAPGDEGEAPGKPHAQDLPGVGHWEGHPEGGGACEGDGPLEGPLAHPAFPGEDGPIPHEGHQAPLGKALLDIGEVLRLVDVGEEGPRVQVLEETPEVLQKGLEEPRRLLPQDAPAMGGKAQAEAQMKLLPQVGPGPLQDLGAFHGHVDLPGVAASPHPGQGAKAGLEAP